MFFRELLWKKLLHIYYLVQGGETVGIELTQQQVHLVYEIDRWWSEPDSQVFEFTGGSGTGKSTVISYFIDKIGLKYNEVAFLCLQGKGAMELARKGLPARTIHSFIYDYDKELDLDEYGQIQYSSRGKPRTKWVFRLKKELPEDLKLLVIDEASMVNESLARDILSFGLPVIALGDLNQLPPVFGQPFFLNHVRFTLTQIMRQSEDDPIVYLANQILEGKGITYGKYGKSMVLPRRDLSDAALANSDIVITSTNQLRHTINCRFRENILQLKRLNVPHVGERIICRKNNWSRCIENTIYMTNGMCGKIDYVDMSSYKKGVIKVDFHPEFLEKKFKNVKLDFDRLFKNPAEVDQNSRVFNKDQFEFAYAITCWLAQGSEWDNVIYLHERIDDRLAKSLLYTAITRAKKQILVYT